MGGVKRIQYKCFSFFARCCCSHVEEGAYLIIVLCIFRVWVYVSVCVVSEVGELMLSSVMFDPFSGDSRIVLGDAVLDFIDQNKPFTIESVPQADLERQDCSVKEINYFRYKNHSLIATVHLDAFHHLPPILPMEGDQPWPLRDETFEHPAQDDPGDESTEIAVQLSPEAFTEKATHTEIAVQPSPEAFTEKATRVIQQSRGQSRERQVCQQKALENRGVGEPEVKCVSSPPAPSEIQEPLSTQVRAQTDAELSGREVENDELSVVAGAANNSHNRAWPRWPFIDDEWRACVTREREVDVIRNGGRRTLFISTTQRYSVPYYDI